MTDRNSICNVDAPSRALSAYLLGTLDFDAFLSLQRRLVYDLGEDRTGGAVIICDHPPGVTIGREGSRAHIRHNVEMIAARLRCGRQNASESHSRIRWVSRGGGAMLHLAGQVACYPIIPLELLGLTTARYLDEFLRIGVELLRKYNISGIIDEERPGVRVNGRRVMHLGVAVREGITCFGVVLNVDPDLELFREVFCDADRVPMTSLQRESRGTIRLSGIRQQLLELIATRFGFDRVSIFHNHPGTLPRSTRYVAAPRS